MGLFGTIIAIATAAVATKKVGEKLIEKTENSKTRQTNIANTAKKEETKLDHDQELEKMTHKKRLENSQFDQNGKLVYSKKCPSCGKMDSFDAVYCSYCGEEMEIKKVKCQYCQRLVLKNSMFCNHCGEKLNFNNNGDKYKINDQ